MSGFPILSAPSFYVVGGTMRPEAQSYVRRSSDEELYTALMENDFCHVLTARQMGKSSLMLRTAARLRNSGIGVAALDLTGIGTNLSPEQWYSGLIVQLGDRLNLEDKLLEFWSANLSVGPMQRWISAIRKVVMPSRTGRLAIFIDEIDAVASLNFSTDEFFSGIRECYNLRHEDAEIRRLTFCLLGVVNPSELIRDTRTTPFNVGRRIDLNDFTEQEALPLAEGLGRSATENRALLKRIFYWTNGHPYLTQRLCKVVSENDIHNAVDELIEQTFFSKRAQQNDDNLIFVRERLLRSGADVTALLNLYSHVRRNKRVAADDSQPLVGILRLSGVTRSENGRLRVRNRIYDRVFNGEWVKANLPNAEVRRQRAAFRRGVVRTMAVAAVILTIMAALAITALRQRDQAREKTKTINELLYAARMKFANQEYQNANIGRLETWVEATTPQPGEEDLRGFEWFLFWRYANSEVMRIKEPGHVANATFHKGDDTIAIADVPHAMINGSRHYLIRLYDRRSQKYSVSFEVPAGTTFDIATFSSDGKYVATDAPDRSVALWDLSSRQLVHSFPGSGQSVVSVVFAPDQKLIAATFVQGAFRVWDLDSKTEKLGEQSKLDKPGIAFSSDGKYLAIGMDHNIVTIRETEGWKPLRSFPFPKRLLGLIFFSPDRSKLFATTPDGDIYARNVRSGQLLTFSESHSNEISTFSFSPDGKTLATGSLDRTLKLWDVSTGKHLRTILGHGGWLNSVDWSADGQYLLSSDSNGLIKMWEMKVREMPVWPVEKPATVFNTSITPQNELIAIGLGSDGNLKLWNLSSGEVLADQGPVKEVTSAAFSKDATLVAVAVEPVAAVAPEIRIYSLTTGKLIRTLADSATEVYSLEFSPDGTKLLSGSRKRDVIVSEISTGLTALRLNSGNTYYRAVFSPDGKKIASADKDGTIRIWDVGLKAIQKNLTGHEGVVKLLSFSPNGRMLASAGDDNTVRLWDTATGQELKQPIGSDPVDCLTFTPDGKRLVTISFDGAVVLWDPNSMQEVVTLQKGGRSVRPSSISFSRDGLILVVSDEKGNVRVWQAGQPDL